MFWPWWFISKYLQVILIFQQLRNAKFKKNEAKLINIWRGKRNCRNLPAGIRRHHAIDVDPITQLQGYSHSKPAGAQPGVGTLPGRKEKLFRKD